MTIVGQVFISFCREPDLFEVLTIEIEFLLGLNGFFRENQVFYVHLITFNELFFVGFISFILWNLIINTRTDLPMLLSLWIILFAHLFFKFRCQIFTISYIGFLNLHNFVLVERNMNIRQGILGLTILISIWINRSMVSIFQLPIQLLTLIHNSDIIQTTSHFWIVLPQKFLVQIII